MKEVNLENDISGEPLADYSSNTDPVKLLGQGFIPKTVHHLTKEGNV